MYTALNAATTTTHTHTNTNTITIRRERNRPKICSCRCKKHVPFFAQGTRTFGRRGHLRQSSLAPSLSHLVLDRNDIPPSGAAQMSCSTRGDIHVLLENLHSDNV